MIAAPGETVIRRSLRQSVDLLQQGVQGGALLRGELRLVRLGMVGAARRQHAEAFTRDLTGGSVEAALDPLVHEAREFRRE